MITKVLRTKCKGDCEGTPQHEQSFVTLNLRCLTCGAEHEPSDSEIKILTASARDEISIMREHILRLENYLYHMEQLKAPAPAAALPEIKWKKYDDAMPCHKCGTITRWARNGVPMCENSEHARERAARRRESDKWSREDIMNILLDMGYGKDDETEVIKSAAKLIKGGTK